MLDKSLIFFQMANFVILSQCTTTAFFFGKRDIGPLQTGSSNFCAMRKKSQLQKEKWFFQKKIEKKNKNKEIYWIDRYL